MRAEACLLIFISWENSYNCHLHFCDFMIDILLEENIVFRGRGDTIPVFYFRLSENIDCLQSNY